MKYAARLPQILLILGFLTVIMGVPLTQIVIELYRGGPVQCTDLFHHAPTTENLRQFEQLLEESWWGRDTLRPQMQRVLFATLRGTGTQAIAGGDNWIFYRPGVRYLVEADKPDIDESESTWVEPQPVETCHDNVVQAIVRVRDQLKQREIKLLVVPVPGKASVYPDKLSRRFLNRWDGFRSPTEAIITELDARGVQTVNLFALFREARLKQPQVSAEIPYYLPHDTHWTPAGAKLAAAEVARELRRLEWTAEYPYKYSTKRTRVIRSGDLYEMMQLPGAKTMSFGGVIVECEQILDPFFDGLMVPGATGRQGTYMNGHLIDTPMEASFLLGDSYSRIYQIAEPASLGQVVDVQPETDPSANPKEPPSRDSVPGNNSRRQLLPGSAGFPSLLAHALQAPVDYIISDGGAATEVRQRLNTNSEILDNKKVVIWEFTERDIRLGRNGWQNVPLPP